MQCFPDKEVKFVEEMLGVSKDKIKVNAYDNMVEVKSEDPQREYHRTIEIPLETAKSAYNNGILEITFSKPVNHTRMIISRKLNAKWSKDTRHN